MTDQPMTPWPSDMVAVLPDEDWPKDENAIGWLTFIDPAEKVRTSLPVSTGPSREGELYPIWHIERDGPEHVITTPSIHVPGVYHSPGTVRWRLVANDLLEAGGGVR